MINDYSVIPIGIDTKLSKIAIESWEKTSNIGVYYAGYYEGLKEGILIALNKLKNEIPMIEKLLDDIKKRLFEEYHLEYDRNRNEWNRT